MIIPPRDGLLLAGCAVADAARLVGLLGTLCAFALVARVSGALKALQADR